MIVYTIVLSGADELPSIVQTTDKAHADATYAAWESMGDNVLFLAFDVDKNEYVDTPAGAV